MLPRFTKREWTILEYLTRLHGQVFSREKLLDLVWGADELEITDRAIDQHMRRIRKKFRAVDGSFNCIKTIYGVGYLWEERAR